MKTINLFFDFEFTSLSPDAQPISLGIVSDEIISGKEVSRHTSEFGNIVNYEAGTIGVNPRSFYAEFSDFDINRCDDWVKENVVSKLKFWNDPKFQNFNFDSVSKFGLPPGHEWGKDKTGNLECFGSVAGMSENLKHWLKQFSDYQIQFIGDCATWDWYWMVQLLGEWETKEIWTDGCPVCGYDAFRICNCHQIKTGLPKLPDNISPVPFDLNDLIAIKKGIAPKEAFDLNREALWQQDILGWSDNELKSVKEMTVIKDHTGENILNKHNALFDAKVIKEIYNKLH